ncbi:MAG: type I restriction-modification enzyme R subunit C-terminal domain-containing protein [Mycobacterium sp.]|uniref:type I restriction-modification enzyme R subunit C-terminal domain-containing protein n=1 Tax=Mycobacterium sp. TaxID=1785 RepID=UPI003C68FAA1
MFDRALTYVTGGVRAFDQKLAAPKVCWCGTELFIRSLVGLDREAALEAFGTYLDGTKFTAEQIRFINLIVNELTANGVMDPARLYESPYTDHTPTGPESVFAEADVDSIVDILNTVKANALPTDGAA